MSAKEEVIGFIRMKLKRLNDDWKYYYRQSDYSNSNAIYEDIQELERLLELCKGEKQPSTDSKCNKHIVSNNEVAVCDHPPSELKLDSGGFKFCKNCGTYPQTDC